MDGGSVVVWQDELKRQLLQAEVGAVAVKCIQKCELNQRERKGGRGSNL